MTEGKLPHVWINPAAMGRIFQGCEGYIGKLNPPPEAIKQFCFEYIPASELSALESENRELKLALEAAEKRADCSREAKGRAACG